MEFGSSVVKIVIQVLVNFLFLSECRILRKRRIFFILQYSISLKVLIFPKFYFVDIFIYLFIFIPPCVKCSSRFLIFVHNDH